MDSFRRLVVSFKINYSIDEQLLDYFPLVTHRPTYEQLYSIYDVIVPMPPYSYVVSFGDIRRYLVETRTTSSQEGIVRWTVILRNLGRFPHGSSSTQYELWGGW